MRWPEPEAVLAATQRWADRQACTHPAQRAEGIYGSYGRGDAGVGSDLDLVLVVDDAQGPQWQRLRAWPLGELPLSADALVLRPEELDALEGRMADTLRQDCRWLWQRGASDTRPPGHRSLKSDCSG